MLLCLYLTRYNHLLLRNACYNTDPFCTKIELKCIIQFLKKPCVVDKPVRNYIGFLPRSAWGLKFLIEWNNCINRWRTLTEELKQNNWVWLTWASALKNLSTIAYYSIPPSRKFTRAHTPMVSSRERLHHW